MTTAEDLKKYPAYFYDRKNKILLNWEDVGDWINIFGYTWHHFIRQQWIRNNPDKFKQVEHLQKLIYLPTFADGADNMHGDLHSYHSKFEEKWGCRIDELLWNEKL
jgi:hypothetical protein